MNISNGQLWLRHHVVHARMNMIRKIFLNLVKIVTKSFHKCTVATSQKE